MRPRLALTTALLLGALADPVTTQALVGLELVASESAETTASSIFHTASCPAGKVAVSGGGQINGGGSTSGRRALVQSLPDGDPPTGWSVFARDLDEDGLLWSVTARAWCAQAPPGFVRSGKTTTFFTTPLLTLSHQCPAGTELLSTGIGVFGAPSAVPFRLAPPEYSAGGVWNASGRDFDGGQDPWLLRIDLLCANVRRPLLLQTTTSSSHAGGSSLETTCPTGWLPLGAGVEASGSTQPAYVLRRFYPGLTSFDDVPAVWRLLLGGLPFQTTDWALRMWTVCHQDPLFADGFEDGGTSAWGG